MLGGEPFAHHADADDETSSDKAHEEAGEGEHFIAVREGEGGAENAAGHEHDAVGEAGPEFVDEHADDDASGDGEGDVENEEGLPLGFGEIEGGHDGVTHGGMTEPEDEGEEKGEPGEVKGADGGAFEARHVEFF